VNVPVSLSALDLTASALSRKPRILVLGAGGWFGKTALSLIAGHTQSLRLIGSYERAINVNGKPFHIEKWSEEEVAKFRPEIVLDFAYLTRGFLADYGYSEYVRINRELSRRILALTSLESVEGILTVSSGAAVGARNQPSNYVESDPYGALKDQFEGEFLEAAQQRSVSAFIARAWSVSGGFVGQPMNYALSSFALQAMTARRIEIEADSLVYRRYCAIEDFLAVSLANLMEGVTGELDSGGRLVEMAELALEIAAQVEGTDIVEKQPDRRKKETKAYCSDNMGWEAQVKARNYLPASLPDQIANVITALDGSLP